MVLHGVALKRENGEKRYIVRGYGIKDNPKKTLEERGSFLDGDLQSFINLNNLKAEDIWEGEALSSCRKSGKSCFLGLSSS